MSKGPSGEFADPKVAQTFDGRPVGTDPAQVAPYDGKQWFGQPRGLATLFFTEMWERFSYYGMRGLLTLYMVLPVVDGGLGFSAGQAGAVYGMYTALVYLVALPGGWIADNVLGQRTSTLWGGVVIALGHFTMAFPSTTTFYAGLGLIVIGTGLLKPNISVMVGQLYGAEDERRDSGFSIFYMGINLGAFAAGIAGGFVAQSDAFKGFLASMGFAPESSWHWAFGMAGVGMALGLVQYLVGQKYIADTGNAPPASPERQRAVRTLTFGVGATLALIALLAAVGVSGLIAFTPELISNAFGVVLFAIVIGLFAWLFTRGYWTDAERKQLYVIGLLFLGAAVFWSAFEQAGTTLNLFADEKTDRLLGGFEIPSAWFQSLNAMFIFMLAPVFAWLWVYLARRRKEPSSPAKFSIGLLLLGFGFLLLVGGAALAEQGVAVSPMWLVGVYFLHTLGELTLSPVGLSAMTKLAPARVVSLMMGVWFLAAAVGNFMGGFMARFYESLALPTLFGVIGAFAIGAAILMALFVGPVKRMMATAAPKAAADPVAEPA